MLKSEERKKTKLDWEEYYNNWHGGIKPEEGEKDVADDLSSEDEEILPTDMLEDDDFRLTSMKFLKNATLEAERKPRKFKKDEDHDSEHDESLAVRGESG